MVAGFIDPSVARYSRLNGVVGPALFVPLNRPEDLMLVGAGESARVIFLAGGWAGECFPQSRAENWEGMSIGGIRIKVDVASAYAPDSSSKQLLSVVRRGDFVGVFGLLKDRGGFDQRVAVAMNAEADPSTEVRLGFTSWRIVVGEGLAAVSLHTVSSNSPDQG